MLDLQLRRSLGEFSLDVALQSDCNPLVIMGPSGAGKTLVLRAIAGILRPDSGYIAIDAEPLFDSERGIDVPAQDRRVGYVPQDYALFPHLTVEGNVAFGLARDDGKRERVQEMLDLVGLNEQRALRPRQLSGGQRQRVAVARALAVRPQLLLLDEPFAALDTPSRESLLDEVRHLMRATATPTVVVTHDRNEALRLGGRIAVLMDGRIRQAGAPTEVFGSPADEDVANFVGVETVVPGRVRAVTDGVATVDVAGHAVQGGTGVGPADDVLFCLRPEDVTLTLDPAGAAPASARNHLPATVSRIEPSGAYIRVQLDAGFPLAALITKDALEDLDLEPGSRVVATFKATAVHLIPRQT